MSDQPLNEQDSYYITILYVLIPLGLIFLLIEGIPWNPAVYLFLTTYSYTMFSMGFQLAVTGVIAILSIMHMVQLSKFRMRTKKVLREGGFDLEVGQRKRIKKESAV